MADDIEDFREAVAKLKAQDKELGISKWENGLPQGQAQELIPDGDTAFLDKKLKDKGRIKAGETPTQKALRDTRKWVLNMGYPYDDGLICKTVSEAFDSGLEPAVAQQKVFEVLVKLLDARRTR